MYTFPKIESERDILQQAKILTTLLQDNGVEKYTRENEFTLRKLIEAILALMWTEGNFNNFDSSSKKQKELSDAFINHLNNCFIINDLRTYSPYSHKHVSKFEKSILKIDSKEAKGTIAIERWKLYSTITERGYPDNFKLAIYELSDMVKSY